MLLKIDQELKNLIPPLTHEDRTGLETNIKANGCETPITVWDGTIIDGHNRYEICIANGIPFEVKEMHFADKDDAKVWMIKHELEWKGRRLLPAIRLSLTDKMRSIISEKARINQIIAGATFGNASVNVDKSIKIEPIDTRAEIAKIAQVSTGTVGKYDIIQKEGTDEQKSDVLDGKASINKVYEEIKRGKLKTPEHLMDKSEPVYTGEINDFGEEEIIYESSNETDAPELKEIVDKNPDVEDHDHCVYTPFIPKKADLHMCPCGCGYGYIEQNEKWYTKKQIKEIKE